ncbi:hypothetical protein BH18ACT13_BH18ACT13_17720 [soil metagenome]
MALPPATASTPAARVDALVAQPLSYLDVQLPPWQAAPRRVSIGERAAKNALEAVGVPYRWGGTSPETGFDCSGLVRWAYGRLGIEVPHSSYALWSSELPVERARMRVGDVLVSSGIGHVGMYLGAGRMVHAPYSGTEVQVVSLASTSYGTRLVGVRRVTRG